MAKSEDKVLEALAGLVSPEAQEKVKAVVTSLLDEATADLNAKYQEAYNTKLAEAYGVIVEEREKDWQTARQGYSQARDIISDLRTRLSRQHEEHKLTMKEEFAKAYEVIKAEKAKNEDLEKRIYEQLSSEYESKLEKLVDQVDRYLDKEAEKMRESIMAELLNDPYLAEHRVAFDRVVDVVRDFISDEDIALNTNGKVSELERKVESMEIAHRDLKSRNTRLMTENNQMKDYLKETKELIEKNILNEQNARLETARKVEGRGKTVNEPEREVVIGEHVQSTTAGSKAVISDEPRTIEEQWCVLAGQNRS